MCLCGVPLILVVEDFCFRFLVLVRDKKFPQSSLVKLRQNWVV